ncbi:tetratricopeptide repeat protein [Limisalsivibrio acetivorans]|uniref:tetratricopeptide repeat protein n=1 Tax=Limisalsivibrio acetivorans TaxID=1304888 RepID=UPI0003B4EB7D|nr:tetratricopeptide repeat protein [Limisalsivibrio acetivorans]
MLTLLISVAVSVAASLGLYYATYSFAWAIALAVLLIILINVLMGRHFLNKLKGLFASVEKDLKAGRNEKAIEKLKDGYQYANWQFFVKEQINSQIGMILYANKKFEDARPYLEKGFKKNWMGLAMLAALYYKDKNMEKAIKTMETAVKNAPKEGFPYSFLAWLHVQNNETDKAIDVLGRGTKKNPLDERLESDIELLKNGKKLKMERYGTVWMQLHLGKLPEGAKHYQQFLANQRIKRK